MSNLRMAYAFSGAAFVGQALFLVVASAALAVAVPSRNLAILLQAGAALFLLLNLLSRLGLAWLMTLIGGRERKLRRLAVSSAILNAVCVFLMLLPYVLGFAKPVAAGGSSLFAVAQSIVLSLANVLAMITVVASAGQSRRLIFRLGLVALACLLLLAVQDMAGALIIHAGGQSPPIHFWSDTAEIRNSITTWLFPFARLTVGIVLFLMAAPEWAPATDSRDATSG